ncbi:hypothetical protein [Aliiroseovarius sediminis]|uniref:hypothetical protein n=1 Tax=Aliiroseovarius sediminis TaxID=2925839 RepID=UPI001F58CDCC|nr:hypothetical protein [Aliiroseovarius sediminis]MCI2394172.1 hypothetical protein [Aliiroseovarius sediminis]
MRRFTILAATAATIALAGCQSDKSNAQTSRGAASFCDRVVGWQPINGEPEAERAVTRAEVCAKPAGDGVWVKVAKVHPRLRTRSYWVLLPADDRHLGRAAGDASPVLAGWVLQARPFGWAHEVVAVRSSGNAATPALTGAACPRKAVGKKPSRRYCVAVN